MESSLQTELVELPHEMETGNFESDSQSQAVAAARLARQKARGRPTYLAGLFFRVEYDMDTCRIQDAPPKFFMDSGYEIHKIAICKGVSKREKNPWKDGISFWSAQEEVTSITEWQGVAYAL